MKTCFITLLIAALVTPVYSQDLRFDVHGAYSRSIRLDKVRSATLVGHILPNFPSDWIAAYELVEISSVRAGKTVSATGANAILSSEQQNVLKSAVVGADIAISIKYKRENAVTGVMETNTMRYQLTVVPDIEAEYRGGYQRLQRYLDEYAIGKITVANLKELQTVSAIFTVDEEGGITEARIKKTSGDNRTDSVLLDAIRNMPPWKPAELSGGLRVKQNFVFTVAGGDDC